MSFKQWQCLCVSSGIPSIVADILHTHSMLFSRTIPTCTMHRSEMNPLHAGPFQHLHFLLILILFVVVKIICDCRQWIAANSLLQVPTASARRRFAHRWWRYMVFNVLGSLTKTRLWNSGAIAFSGLSIFFNTLWYDVEVFGRNCLAGDDSTISLEFLY